MSDVGVNLLYRVRFGLVRHIFGAAVLPTGLRAGWNTCYSLPSAKPRR